MEDDHSPKGATISSEEGRESSGRSEGKLLDFCAQTFTSIFKDQGTKFTYNFQTQLRRAGMDVSAAAYLGSLFFTDIAFAVLFILLTVFEFLLHSSVAVTLVLIPFSLITVTGLGLYLPFARASSRGKAIDANLGSALSFISAMSGADVPINVIMLRLSEMPEFGGVSKEASKIAFRTEVLGKDVFTAMQEVARESPSVEWQKFLQGAVATSIAGARLKPYFVNRAAEYQATQRINLKKNAESVSVFAEAYVTVGVVLPLFLIVILAVMAVAEQNASGGILSFLIILSFLVLPVMTAAFVTLISSVNKEVQIS